VIKTTISAGSSAKPDVDGALIDLAAAEIAELRIQHRPNHYHPRDEAGGKEGEQDDEQAADQCHGLGTVIACDKREAFAQGSVATTCPP